MALTPSLTKGIGYFLPPLSPPLKVFSRHAKQALLHEIAVGYQKNYRFICVCESIGKSAVTKCHTLLSKVISIKEKSRFGQLATTSSSVGLPSLNVLLNCCASLPSIIYYFAIS